MNDQKQNALIAFIFFNITVVVYQIAFNHSSGEISYGGIGGRMFTSVLVGLGVGGIVWGACAVIRR